MLPRKPLFNPEQIFFGVPTGAVINRPLTILSNQNPHTSAASPQRILPNDTTRKKAGYNPYTKLKVSSLSGITINRLLFCLHQFQF